MAAEQAPLYGVMVWTAAEQAPLYGVMVCVKSGGDVDL
jgi:hypothetical protein